MATECTQEAVLCFLTERGGRVKKADFINHFRSSIPTEPERKAAAEEAFRSCVDSVALVKAENGEKYVCLRKRFRGSVKREDGHHGPDSAAVLETSLSAAAAAAVTHDNRRDAPVIPGESQSRALNTTVPSENKDAKQEIPPASVCAGAGARTPPNISQTSPDGSAARACTQSVAHESEDKTEMGNHNTRNAGAGSHSRSVRRSDETPRDAQSPGKRVPEVAVTEPSHQPATDGSKFFHLPCLPTHAGALSQPRADQSHTDGAEGESAPKAREEDTAGAGSGSRLLSLGSCEGGADEGGRSDSASNTPKGSRKSFIEHMMSSSPQVRRSMVLRHSRHAAKSDGDSSSVNSAHAEEESAAATLDPLEHEWMMCACDGDWDTLRRLLNTDPSLVSKKDFVTGFTCLHWAAKLGKHELLAQIVTFARQRGVALDVNARSSAGYTPLHLAAMHNHIEVIKLLVGACDADVEARDYSGKKANQYLRGDVARDVLDIAGADAACDPESEELALGDEGARWKLPRVLQANLRLLNRSASEDDDRDCVGGLARERPLRRKSSFNKLKPRLSKVRAGITPIVHSTSHFERLEGATGQTSGPVRTRPKSNLFG
ncbi:ankyrin repeat domain-containing protein SOWAHC [Pangasianodon hypophthalmus]|uniref:ankyrin repeat domain-containing protein SOWAHC n=1 Tax=Pangasianodon hypophthalmus TaxID=310915 RepID=UPI000EFED287|nr:ankyrin repeat domain-containing protein SOWAHC [Pangasianodon hypophthalmus]